MDPPRTPRPRELPALTALRFVLAVYAMLYHVEVAWSPAPAAARGGVAGLVEAVLSAGYVSVNGFFVLSGFVLAYTYADVDGDVLPRGARAFFRARFARVYPVHVVGIALSVPLLFAANRAAHVPEQPIVAEAMRQVAAVALLVQAWIPSRALDLNGPSWSLSVEAFFYASFPFLVRRLAPLGLRALLVVAAVSFCLLLAPPLVHPLAHGIAGASLDDRVLLFNPLLHLPEVVLGVVAGLAFLKGSPCGTRWRQVAFIVTVAIVGILAVSRSLPVGLLHAGLLDPLVALLLVSLAAGWSRPPRGVAMRAATLLGRASFALYVVHKPVYLWMARETGLGRSAPGTGFVLAYFALTITVSLVLWAAFEEPARRALRGRG